MSDVLKWFAALVVTVAIVIGLLFLFGVVGNKFNETVGREAVSIQRETFEVSKPYVHGKVQDLAKYKREYERATDPAEKKQIRNWVLDEFANFDKNLIDNADLRRFLEELERGTK